jgi:cytochrome c556
MYTNTYRYFLIIILISTIALSATAAEPNLKEIMQGLRDDVVEISDGLLTDDFTRVAQGAARIANHARIPPDQVKLVAAELGTEMAAFKQIDTSVHDLSLSIAAAAEEKDRARAIADYQRMLSGCFACHAAYKDRVGTVLSAAAGIK